MTDSPITAKPKRRRRWYQYSLRTFLLLITIFAIWFGYLANEARKQRQAVAWVHDMGGMLGYDYELDEDGGFKEDAKPPGPNWLRGTLDVNFMADVVWVDLYDTQVSDVKPLAGLQNLEHLYLSGTPVSDVTPLAGLKNLKWFSLTNTEVGDVTPLACLQNLQVLYLTNTPVSDVTPLVELEKLRVLSLVRTQVSEKQVAWLRQALPKCEIWGPD
jgi:hypothetical protein